jgi:hypothetical protein
MTTETLKNFAKAYVTSQNAKSPEVEEANKEFVKLLYKNHMGIEKAEAAYSVLKESLKGIDSSLSDEDKITELVKKLEKHPIFDYAKNEVSSNSKDGSISL